MGIGLKIGACPAPGWLDRRLASVSRRHACREVRREQIEALFSNSGRGVKLSVKILAGSMVLSAVGACPPHDGVR